MATFQRSAVSFRRQGSSGIVWDDKYISGEDGKIELRDQLRPCQSVRETSVSSIPQPASCPRSLSTPAIGKVFPPSFLEKPPVDQKSKSEKKKPWSLNMKKA